MESAARPILSQPSESIPNPSIYIYQKHKAKYTCFLNVNDFSENLRRNHLNDFWEKQFWILCAIPNNKFLCYWQHKTNDVGVLFSLDSEGNLFQLKTLPHKEWIKLIAVYYKNDYAFIFGFEKSYKLNTSKNIFIAIFGGNHHAYYSCALLNEYIIISTELNYHAFEVYDILTNSKSTMNTSVKGGLKHLFTLQENVYAADSDGYIYLLSLWNLNEWKFMGVIKKWSIGNSSYFLYCHNNVYIMTDKWYMVKLEMKNNKLEAEVNQTYTSVIRSIDTLDSSIVFEEALKSFHPLWNDFFNPMITANINKIWSLIVFEKQNLGIFPSILSKDLAVNENWFNSLDVYDRLNYFSEIFKNDPSIIKIVILISRPKEKINEFSWLIQKINMIRSDIDMNQKWIKMKKDIVVLSPIFVFKDLEGIVSAKFNELVFEIAQILNSILNKAAFMLWGKEAKSYSTFIDQSKHLVITNTSLLSTNKDKIENFQKSEQFELARSFIYK